MSVNLAVFVVSKIVTDKTERLPNKSIKEVFVVSKIVTDKTMFLSDAISEEFL